MHLLFEQEPRGEVSDLRTGVLPVLFQRPQSAAWEDELPLVLALHEDRMSELSKLVQLRRVLQRLLDVVLQRIDGVTGEGGVQVAGAEAAGGDKQVPGRVK